VPFGPEISWPHGFRPLDTLAREVLQSAYDSRDQAGPRRWGDGSKYHGEAAGYGTGFAYQQPAIDDYGYGDPGYSDPSYDGPRNPYPDDSSAMPGGTAMPGGAATPPGRPQESGWFQGAAHRPAETAMPGYQVPGIQESSGSAFGYQRQEFPAASSGYAGGIGYSGSDDIYPVTGAQEALPDTGPHPVAGSGTGYPDEWYGHPRLDERVADQGQGPADPRLAGADSRLAGADPRLAGIRYDELRYEEPDGPDYNEPLDDESWYEDLRRNAPAWPQDDQRHVVPPHGQQPGYPQPPVAERGFGPGQDGLGPQPGLAPRNGAQPASGPGPWMTPRGQADHPRPPAPAFPEDRSSFPGDRGAFPGDRGAGFLAAPTAQVGVLTPPAGTSVDDLAGDGPLLAGPSAAEFLGRPAPVRPGHGLDGPEITSSWPALPPPGDLDSFDEFWQTEGGDDPDYSRLFGDEAEPGDAGGRAGAKRRTGRRRGRSSDHRLWLALGGVVVVTAAAITGIIKFEFPSHGGPSHTMATPARIGTYLRTVDLERETKVAELRNEVIKMSSGEASGVVSAVYESGKAAAGSTEQIVMYIGGHLANAAPAASIASFTQKFPGAKVVSAGALGGQAACVQDGTGSDSVSMCAWFDNDSFGEIVSPTMNATALADVMRTMRPSVELVAKK
jgi:hypothetical protein